MASVTAVPSASSAAAMYLRTVLSVMVQSLSSIWAWTAVSMAFFCASVSPGML